MDYKEKVKEKIKKIKEGIKEENCQSLWEEITASYEEGGNNKVKDVLSKKAKEISEKFKELLQNLEKKF